MTKRTNDGQFTQGHSGNSKGKPKGARNKATLASLALIDGESEALTRKAIELALEGDMTALRLCLERIAPIIKERPIRGFELSKLTDSQSVLEALDKVSRALANGNLLPYEAKAICHVLEQYQHHFEITVLNQRLEILESTLKVRS